MVAAVVKPSWSSTSGGMRKPTSTYPQATRKPTDGCRPRAAYVATDPAAGISRASRPMLQAQKRHAIRAKITESGSDPPANATPAGIDAAMAAPGAMSVMLWKRTSRRPIASRRSPVDVPGWAVAAIATSGTCGVIVTVIMPYRLIRGRARTGRCGQEPPAPVLDDENAAEQDARDDPVQPEMIGRHDYCQRGHGGVEQREPAPPAGCGADHHDRDQDGPADVHRGHGRELVGFEADMVAVDGLAVADGGVDHVRGRQQPVSATSVVRSRL